MKRNVTRTRLIAGTAVAGVLLSPSGSTLMAAVTNEDFSPIGDAVVRLLESSDATKFAREISPSPEDFRSLPSTNSSPNNSQARGLDHIRGVMAAGAGRLVEKGRALGLGAPQVRFKVKQVSARQLDMPPQKGLEAGSPWRNLPWAYGIEVTLVGEPTQASGTSEKLRGEYIVLVESGFKFPTGWRCQEGLRWKSFPPGLADEKTRGELALMNKWSVFIDLTMADDSALKQLGNVVVRFLRDRDENTFLSAATQSFDEAWAQLQKKLTELGQGLPSRTALEGPWKMARGKVAASAREVLAQSERMRLTGADIRLTDVLAKGAYRRGGIDSLENITCDELTFLMSVSPDEKDKAKPERPVAGDYAITTVHASRQNGRWTVAQPIRWKQFPSGLFGEKEERDLAFENYVAKRGALPPATVAPEVQFVGLDNGAKVALADFRGKLVVLEFWATWCGPCQKPLAELQTLRQEHPEWKDRVEIITVSLDDTLKLARDHLQQRGWTNTLSVWAGPGGWFSAPAKAFRVGGIPTSYLISPQGRVAWAGHPETAQITGGVQGMLQEPGKLDELLRKPLSAEALRQEAEAH